MSKLVLRGFAQRKAPGAADGHRDRLGVALMAGTYILTDTINHCLRGSVRQRLQQTRRSSSPKRKRSVVIAARRPMRSAKRRSPGCARCRAWPPASGAVSTRAALLTTCGKRLTGRRAPAIVDAVQPPRFEAFTAAKGYLPSAADEVAIDQATAKREHLQDRPADRDRGQRPRRGTTRSPGSRSSRAANPSAARASRCCSPPRRSMWRVNRANTTASTSPRARASPRNSWPRACARPCRGRSSCAPAPRKPPTRPPNSKKSLASCALSF